MQKSICLTVSHNVFLTRNERYELVIGGSVKVIGVSVPIWLLTSGRTTEPGEEVFCWYEISNSDKLLITNSKQGYKFEFPSPMFDRLKDIKDEGSECMMFTNHSYFDIDGEKTYVLNYVSIQDMDATIKSMI